MCCTYQSDNTFVPLQFTLLPKTKMLKSQKNIQPISIFFCTSQQDNLSPHGKKKAPFYSICTNTTGIFQTCDRR